MTTATATARDAVMGDNSETMDIVAMLKEDPKIAFRDPATLPRLLAQLDKQIAEASTDVSTKKAQDEIRSRAASIAKLKSQLDDTGKGLTEDFRRQTKEVNDVRNVITKELDARRDAARAPLTKWEEDDKARKARIEEVRTLLADAAKVPATATIMAVTDLRERVAALVIDPAVYLELAETVEARRLEVLGILDAAKAKLEQDARDQAELAKLRAQTEAAEREKQQAAQRERDAQAARDREAQIRQEAADNAAAEARRIAQAEQDRLTAAAAEQQRIADEKIASANREAEEARAALAAQERQRREDERAEDPRRADQAHRAKVIGETVDAIMQHSRIGAVPANAIVQAIIAGSVPHVALRF